jgi:hypothetical protein
LKSFSIFIIFHFAFVMINTSIFDKIILVKILLFFFCQVVYWLKFYTLMWKSRSIRVRIFSTRILYAMSLPIEIYSLGHTITYYFEQNLEYEYTNDPQ